MNKCPFDSTRALCCLIKFVKDDIGESGSRLGRGLFIILELMIITRRDGIICY